MKKLEGPSFFCSLNNVKLQIAYEGTHFLGWQNNKRGRSVEGELQKALEGLIYHPIKLEAASRTDRGVHALGQIVNFFTPHSLNASFLKPFNQCLPEDIRAISLEITQDTFHPALNVEAKQYRYVISRAKVREPYQRFTSWHFPYIVSLENMREAAARFEGTHDFLGFSNVSIDRNMGSTIRNIYSIEIQTHYEELHLLIKGDHFLYKMVRNIVGTLAYIGSNFLEMSVIEEIFSWRDRKRGGITAPAEGLFLEKIYYTA